MSVLTVFSWLGDLFFRPADPKRMEIFPYNFPNITDFPSHISVVPWEDTKTDRMFCVISGLFYSTLSKCAKGEYLEPRYGTMKYEIDHVQPNRVEEKSGQILFVQRQLLSLIYQLLRNDCLLFPGRELKYILTY